MDEDAPDPLKLIAQPAQQADQAWPPPPVLRPPPPAPRRTARPVLAPPDYAPRRPVPSPRLPAAPPDDWPAEWPEAWRAYYEPPALGRFRMPLRIVLLLLLQFILIAIWFAALTFSGAADELPPGWYLLLSFCGIAAVSVCCNIVLPRWILRRHAAAAALRFRRPTRQDLLLSLLTLGVAYAFWVGYWAVVPWIGWDWLLPVPLPDDRVQPVLDWEYFTLFAAAAILLAPVTEEIFFRGFALGGLTRVWWTLPAVLLSAALFAAAHFNLRVLIPFTFFGILLSALYLRTQHLTAPVLTHTLWNIGATIFLVTEYGVE